MVTVTENRIFDNRKISKTDNAIDDLGFDSSLFYNQFSPSLIIMQVLPRFSDNQGINHQVRLRRL